MSQRFPDLNTGVIYESFQSAGRAPLAREQFITRRRGGASEQAVARSNVGEIPSGPGALCGVRVSRVFWSHPRLIRTGGDSGIGSGQGDGVSGGEADEEWIEMKWSLKAWQMSAGLCRNV